MNRKHLIKKSFLIITFLVLTTVIGYIILYNYKSLKKEILSKISSYLIKDIDYNIEFESIQVSFLKKTALNNVVIFANKDNKQDTLLFLNRIEVETLPFFFQIKQNKKYNIYLDSVFIKAHKYKNGKWNLERTSLKGDSLNKDLSLTKQTITTYLKKIKNLNSLTLNYCSIQINNHKTKTNFDIATEQLKILLNIKEKQNFVSINKCTIKNFNIKVLTNYTKEKKEENPPLINIKEVFEQIHTQKTLSKLFHISYPIDSSTLVVKMLSANISNGKFVWNEKNKKSIQKKYKAKDIQINLNKVLLSKEKLKSNISIKWKNSQNKQNSNFNLSLSRHKKHLRIQDMSLHFDNTLTFQAKGIITKKSIPYSAKKTYYHSTINFEKITFPLQYIIPEHTNIKFNKNISLSAKFTELPDQTYIEALNIFFDKKRIFKGKSIIHKNNKNNTTSINFKANYYFISNKLLQNIINSKNISFNKKRYIHHIKNIGDISGKGALTINQKSINLNSNLKCNLGQINTHIFSRVKQNKININKIYVHSPKLNIILGKKNYSIEQLNINITKNKSAYLFSIIPKSIYSNSLSVKNITLDGSINEPLSFLKGRLFIKDEKANLQSSFTIHRKQDSIYFQLNSDIKNLFVKKNNYFDSSNSLTFHFLTKGNFINNTLNLHTHSEYLKINNDTFLDSKNSMDINISYNSILPSQFNLRSPYANLDFILPMNKISKIFKIKLNNIIPYTSMVREFLFEDIRVDSNNKHLLAQYNNTMYSYLIKINTNNKIDSLLKKLHCAIRSGHNIDINISKANNKKILFVNIPEINIHNTSIKGIKLQGEQNKKNKGKIEGSIKEILAFNKRLHHLSFSSELNDSFLINYLQIKSPHNGIFADIHSESHFNHKRQSVIHFIDSSYLKIGKNNWIIKPSSFSFRDGNILLDNIDISNKDQSIIGKTLIETTNTKDTIYKTKIDIKNFDINTYLTNNIEEYISWDFNINSTILIDKYKDNTIINSTFQLKDFFLNHVFINQINGNLSYNVQDNILKLNAINHEPNHSFSVLGGLSKDIPFFLKFHVYNSDVDILQPLIKSVFRKVKGGGIKGELEILFKDNNLIPKGTLYSTSPITSVVDFTNMTYQIDSLTTHFSHNGIHFDSTTFQDKDGNIGNVLGYIQHKDFLPNKYFFNIESDYIKGLNYHQINSYGLKGEVYGKTSLIAKGNLEGGTLEVNIVPSPPTKIEIDFTKDWVSTQKQSNIYFYSPKSKDNNISNINNTILSNEKDNYYLDITLNIQKGTKNIPLEIYFNKNTNHSLSSYASSNLTIDYSSRKDEYIFNGKISLYEGNYNIPIIGNKEGFVIENEDNNYISWSQNSFQNADLHLNVSKTINNVRLSNLGYENSVSSATSTTNTISDIYLKAIVTGKTSNPNFNFDISFPKTSNIVNDPNFSIYTSYFNTLKVNPSEMSQQVASLLLFRTFSKSTINTPSNVNNQNFTNNITNTLITSSTNAILLNNINYTIQNILNTYITNQSLTFDINYDIYSSNLSSTPNLDLSTTNTYGSRSHLTTTTKKRINDRNNISFGLDLDMPSFFNNNTNPVNANTSNYYILPELNYEYFITKDGRVKLNMYSNINYNNINYNQQNSSGFSLIMTRESDNWFLFGKN